MIWPRLKTDHPGYFLVAVQILLIHAGLGVDALINHHAQPQWQFVNQFVGFTGWAAIHLGVLVAGVIGLYMHAIQVMRAAWFASYLAFIVLGIELVVGVHEAGTSYALPILLFAASLSSLATMREDPVNPAMRARRVVHGQEVYIGPERRRS